MNKVDNLELLEFSLSNPEPVLDDFYLKKGLALHQPLHFCFKLTTCVSRQTEKVYLINTKSIIKNYRPPLKARMAFGDKVRLSDLTMLGLP
jgi:hypothetical protein